MKNYKLLFNLLTLAALAYAVLQIKGYLNQNFVENDTPIKGQLNVIYLVHQLIVNPLPSSTDGIGIAYL